MSSTHTAAKLFRSAGAATFSQFWRVGVTLATTLVLKRVIPASDWGLWGWALPVFMVLGAIRDLGLVYHVIRIKPRPYGNLLALELVWGGVLVGATVLGAPLLGLGYSDPNPDLIPVLRAMALFLFFEGLASVPRVYFEGELAIGRAVLPEIVRNIVFATTSLSLAFAGLGIWSLVIAQVASAGVYAIHLWYRAYPGIPLRWQRGETLRLVLQSLPLAAIWFLAILTRYIDPFILAAQFDGETVGNYDFAYNQGAFMAATILVPAVTRALYPALVAFRSQPVQLMEAYRLATLFVLAIEAPIAFFLFANPEMTLRILGGNQWVIAPIFLRILCFAPLIDPFSRLGGEVLKVYHKDREWIFSIVLTLVSFVVGGIVLTRVFGPQGMAWANYLQLGGLFMVWQIYRIAPQQFRNLLSDLVFLYLAPVPLFLLISLIFDAQSVPRFVASMVAVGAIFALYWWRFGAAFIYFFRGHPTPQADAPD